MHDESTESFCILDSIRYSRGSSGLLDYFEKEIKQSRVNSLSLLNDERLQFPTLYLLQPMINDNNLSVELSPRNKSALDVTKALLKRDSRLFDRLSSGVENAAHSTLKWILQTGFRGEPIDPYYEQIIDMAAILLIKRFNDNTILPEVAAAIFERNREGHYTYDLIWAFLEAGDPASLALIAYRLNSGNAKDMELARKILRFVPCIHLAPDADGSLQYIWVKTWLQENLPFLYCTGENFHQRCDPFTFNLSLEAKYLCRKVSSYNGKVSMYLSDNDKLLLSRFNKLDRKLQELLANYSFYLYRQNIYGWYGWLNAPLLEQIKSVSWMKGGLL